MRLVWSAHAVSDLQTIADYIEHDRNLAISNKVIRSLYEAVRTLRTMPYRGRIGRLPNTRELVVPRLPYLAIYQVSDNVVTILNIVHGAQKWP